MSKFLWSVTVLAKYKFYSAYFPIFPEFFYSAVVYEKCSSKMFVSPSTKDMRSSKNEILKLNSKTA